MQYSEVLDHNAAMRKGRGKKPVLDHLRVEEAENGGHVVEHHFASGGDAGYKEPETHVFSKPLDGDAKPELPEGHVLHHIAKHLGIPHVVMDETHGEPSQEPMKEADEQA